MKTHTNIRVWPLVLALSLLGLLLEAMLIRSVTNNDGHLVYPLDDAYIHMAMAKNFSNLWVWGVTGYEFSSSSSSPLWVLLLSCCYSLFGVHDLAPLILNVIFGVLLLVSVYQIIRTQPRPPSPTWQFVILSAVMVFAALPALVVCGMEHVFQALINLPFVYLAARNLSNKEPRTLRRDVFLLSLLAPLVPMARYEGLFLLLVVCALYVVRRRWPTALLLASLGALPVLIYGLISLNHSGLFLPNSVLMKGLPPSWKTLSGMLSLFGYSCIVRLLAAPEMLFLGMLALVAYVLRFHRTSPWETTQLMLGACVLLILLHMELVPRRDFRYEFYLIVLGLTAIGSVLPEFLPKSRLKFDRRLLPKYAAIFLLILLPVAALATTGIKVLPRITLGTTNIYQQQYQMGLFLNKNYPGASVAANDIGTINYLSDIRCLDLVGVATPEVTKMKLGDQYTREGITRLAQAKNVGLAIVYDAWYREGNPHNPMPPGHGGLPEQWIKVGEWKIPNNVVCGDDTVTFYGVGAPESARLASHLAVFTEQLPIEVEYEFHPVANGSRSVTPESTIH